MLEFQRAKKQIRYVETPGSVDKVLEILNRYQEKARIMAGGTDLLIELERNMRSETELLVDITRLGGLNKIEAVSGGRIRLGCLVTHNQAIASDLLRQHAWPLVQASAEVGSPQLRNRATIVGNLVTASPANDTISALIVLGAELIVRHASHGEKVIPLSRFFMGVRRTTLAVDEFVTHIEFDKLEPATDRGIFVKLGLRRAQAISVVHAGVVLRAGPDSIISDARVSLGSVAPTVRRYPEVEQAIIGKTLSDDVIDLAVQGIEIRPIDDLRSTAAYRSQLAKTMLQRSLKYISTNNGQGKLLGEDSFVYLWGDTQGQSPAGSEWEATHEASSCIQFDLNGSAVSVPFVGHKSLLHMLREDAKLPNGESPIGSKEGCSEGECGACTCFLDGMAVMSCLVPATRAHGTKVTTIEGVSEVKSQMTSLQAAFVQTGAVQCGYCIPGFIMSGTKLLEEYDRPGQDQIMQAFAGNLCRCTGYYKIIQAFDIVAKDYASTNKIV